MIQRPNLLKVIDYPITDKISVHIPTVNEIFDFGDMKYYNMLQSLIATPFDLMVELDDIGIDYETLTDYQLFILMMQSISCEKDTSILFGNLDLSKLKVAEDTKNGEYILYDSENGIKIDQLVASEICNIIRKIHFWDLTVGRAGNIEAKQYLIERNRIKKKRIAKKPYKSFLENMIISLVNTEEFKYDYNSVLELSIYKLNASWKQIQRKKNWEQIMNGIYFGTVDLSKINFEKISWLSPE